MNTPNPARDIDTPLSAEAATPATPTSPDLLLNGIKNIVAPLAESLGPGVEVVLHDLREIPDSIIAVGGKLSGRATGGPSTNLLLQHVREQRTDHLLRYRNRTDHGRELLSSTLFLRDESQRAIACLCINVDISQWLELRQLVDTHVSSLVEDAGEPAPQESFFTTTDDLVDTMIGEAIETVEVPVELMHKPHKLRVVADLDDRGFFSFREAAEILAKALGVSRYTIYNYLNETRAAQDNPTQG